MDQPLDLAKWKRTQRRMELSRNLKMTYAEEKEYKEILAIDGSLFDTCEWLLTTSTPNATLQKDYNIVKNSVERQRNFNSKAWDVIDFLRSQLINNASMLDENPLEYIKHIEGKIQEIMASPAKENKNHDIR